MELVVRNVNMAFSEIFWKLKAMDLKPQQTRNGPALVFPKPVTTVYIKPDERVLFNLHRDCNPVFHLLESIWMLAGRNDVAFLSQFNKNMVNFSDDGLTFNAAYGYRWRKHFGFDQIAAVIKVLKEDPTSRQAVVQIWDAADLTKSTKDKACNTQIIFDMRHGSLDMLVVNRSNDLWWGAYGANAVHFSFLHEFVASALGVDLGVYRQSSHNLHLYTRMYDVGNYLQSPPVMQDGGFYATCAEDEKVGAVRPRKIMVNDHWESFLNDCERFCENPYIVNSYEHSFFNDVAVPMANVIYHRRNGMGDGMAAAEMIQADDWKLAAKNWIARRERNKMNRAG